MEFHTGPSNATISYDIVNVTEILASKVNVNSTTFLAISQPTFSIIIFLYIVVITLASLGSILIITTVICVPELKTESNLYLVNLAFSDLFLVTISCPATLTQVSSPVWLLPPFHFLCQLVRFLPLFFSFASTFSICLIALDRHQLIVHTRNHQPMTSWNLVSLLGVWILAFLCSVPILLHSRLEIITLSPNIYQLLGVRERTYCIEDWGYPYGR